MYIHIIILQDISLDVGVECMGWLQLVKMPVDMGMDLREMIAFSDF